MPILFSEEGDGSHRLGVEGSSCSRPLTRLRLGTFNGAAAVLLAQQALESLIGNGVGAPPVSRFLYPPAL